MKNLTKDLFPVLECEQRYSAGLTLRPVLTFVKNSPHLFAGSYHRQASKP